MPPLAAETPQPGDPASILPDDMLLPFLHRKLAGEALPAAAAAARFHDADIYASDPATLTSGFDPVPAKKGNEGGSWFFFTYVKPKSSNDARKARMVGGGAGTWHSERAPKAVFDGEGSCVGHSQYFCYKRNTGKNCKERTDWYMVEFTEGQEGDHERIHGGEPMLVLCKIYKAHANSRSSSSSRSARKRKLTDEHVHIDQSSAPPVKAKRRLLAPAPSPAAASQEKVSSLVTMAQGEAAKSELEASNSNISSTSDGLVLLTELMVNKTSTTSPSPNKNITGTPSQTKVNTASPSFLLSESEFLTFWPDPEASQIDNTSNYLNFLSEMEELQKLISTAPTPLMLEPDVSMLQGVLGMSDWGTEASHMIYSASDCHKFSSKTQALHETSSTPPSLSMFQPEVSALQCEATMFDLGTKTSQMINGISDYPKSSYEKEALQKASTSFPSQSMFEPEVSEPQGEMTTFDLGTEALQLQKIDGTSHNLEFSSEALQKTSTSLPNLSMFEQEVSVLQDETSTFDWGTQMAGSSIPPASVHYYEMTDLMNDGFSSRFPPWGQHALSFTGNDNSTTASCCRSQGWFVGTSPTYDVWGC